MPEPIEAPSESQAGAIENGDIDAVISQLGAEPSGATVHLYRIEGGKRRFVGGYAPQEFDLPTIQRVHRGGDYFVQIKRGTKIVRGQAFSMTDPAGAEPQASGAQAAAPRAASPDAGISGTDVIKLILSQQAATVQLIQAASAQTQQLMLAMIQRPEQGLKLADVLPLIDKSKGSAGAGLADIIDAVETLSERFAAPARSSSGGEGNAIVSAILAGLAPVVAEFLKAKPASPQTPRKPVENTAAPSHPQSHGAAARGQEPAPKPAAPAPQTEPAREKPAPAPVIEPAPGTAPAPEPEPEIMQRIRADLIAARATKRTPQQAAEMLAQTFDAAANATPDDGATPWDMLDQTLPGVLPAIVIEQEPSLRDAAEWLAQVETALRAISADAEEPETTPPPKHP